MIKSLKGQLIISILVAVGFIYSILTNIEFIDNKRDPTIPIIFFCIMIFWVYNAGLLTEKYIQTRRKK